MILVAAGVTQTCTQSILVNWYRVSWKGGQNLHKYGQGVTYISVFMYNILSSKALNFANLASSLDKGFL